VTPYPSANAVLNIARGRLNDDIETLQPISGEILDNGEALTLVWWNAAWVVFQQALADGAYPGFKQDNLVFLGVPPVASLDPALQASITFSGYNNGSAPSAAPILPQNLLRPYKLWERASGLTPPAIFTQMDEVFGGLPPASKGPWNRSWEWRVDGVYLPGAKLLTDIRMRYGLSYPPFADIITEGPQPVITPWYEQPVLVLQCEDALANYLCAEVCKAQQSPLADAYNQAGIAGTAKILNRGGLKPVSANSEAA